MARPSSSPAAILVVRAKPRAKKSKILGYKEGELEVALAAPPVDGAANEELVRVLAEALGVPARAVSIERGASGRHKRVRIEGVDAAALEATLGVARPAS